MLIPLTRKTFERLIPAVATGAQYGYCWGKLPDFLRRLLISMVGVLVITLGLSTVLGNEYGLLRFSVGVAAGLYWFWGPVLWASLRNLEYRRIPYSGFWRGEVLDVYITEELIGKEETVNNRGDLVIVENRERCINLEIGDETGFSTRLSVPLKRSHQAIAIGDPVEMVVMSNRGDLGRINQTSDIYIPNHNLWVSDYPYLQRDAFVEVSRQLKARDRRSPNQDDRSERRRSPNRDESSRDANRWDEDRQRGDRQKSGRQEDRWQPEENWQDDWKEADRQNDERQADTPRKAARPSVRESSRPSATRPPTRRSGASRRKQSW